MLKLYCSADGEGSKIKQEETANCVFVSDAVFCWEVLGMFSKWKKKTTTYYTWGSHCHYSVSKHKFYWGSDTILTVAHKVSRYCLSCPRGGGISPFPSISTTHGKDVKGLS